MTDPFMLLSCPCGASRNTLAITHSKAGKKIIFCPCGKSGRPGRTEMEAINAWNTAPWRIPEKTS